MAEFAGKRCKVLQDIFQEEADRAFAEASDNSARQLHRQCKLDFSRADYTVGADHFAAGCDAEGELAKFIACLERECGGSERLVYVASALASQMSMAHLGSACYSGPHAYAVSAGATLPKYSVQSQGSHVLLLAFDRISENFEHFSLPGDDPHACDKASFIRQHASVRLRQKKEAGVVAEVLDAWEAIKLVWPDRRLVVNDGLVLDFRSPPRAGRLRVLVKRLYAAGPWELAGSLVVFAVSYLESCFAWLRWLLGCPTRREKKTQ